jgi:hypothetical protein
MLTSTFEIFFKLRSFRVISIRAFSGARHKLYLIVLQLLRYNFKKFD